MIKKFAATAAVTLGAAVASVAFAQSARMARVTAVEPTFAVETIVDTTERCETVREPVYANNTTTTIEGNGDVLGGLCLALSLAVSRLTLVKAQQLVACWVA